MKSRKRIICDNLFTLFNFLNFAIAGLLFAVGAYKNMLFLGVIILNIIIGTAQELKARKLVEELSLLNRPSVRLFADGREHAAALEDLKQGDVMILQSGDQICADAEIVSGTLEVNESLLTGESDAIVKDTGSGVLSGSSVISGKAYARVLRAGEDSYTAKLSSEVKKIKQAESELLGSMKKVTKFTSFLIIPLGILLFLEAFVMRSELVDSAILSSSAASASQVREHFPGSTGADFAGNAEGCGTGACRRLPRGSHRILRKPLGEQRFPCRRRFCRCISLCWKIPFGRERRKRWSFSIGKALRSRSFQVAMTGDGVNDLLALREADCSIAVADGSDASRQVAQVVLLESDFTQLPQVVMEGRRVVNNVTRTAGVFFIKTIYSLLVSFLCLALNMPFPFIPIQITLVDACMEAYPSFLTILEAHTEKIRGKFLPTALGNALPYGIAVSAMVAAVSLTSSFGQPQTQTVMYLLLILISMVAVFRSCIPINPLRLFICVTNVIGTFGALLILPDLFSVSAVTMPMALYIAGALAGSFAVIAAFEDPLEKGLKGQIPNHHWWETYLSNTYWTVLLIGVLVCFGLILMLLVVSYISTKRLNRMIMKPVNAPVSGGESQHRVLERNAV